MAMSDPDNTLPTGERMMTHSHDAVIEAMQHHIKIVEAHKAGKKVEYLTDGVWFAASKTQPPAFAACKYRIAAEPFECWMNIQESGRCDPYKTQADAVKNAGSFTARAAVPMREVV
jgi:hypothetical protein